MQSIQIKPLPFNWDSSNLHEQWKLFREQCQFLLTDKPYSKHTESACIAFLLNWMGPCSYQIFNNLMFSARQGQEETCQCFKSSWWTFQTYTISSLKMVLTW